MEKVRVPFIEVRDQRILLLRIEVLRLVEKSVDRLTISGYPRNEFDSSPEIVLLLGIDVADAIEIGSFAEIAARHDQLVTLLCLLWDREKIGLQCELPRRETLVEFQGVEA